MFGLYSKTDCQKFLNLRNCKINQSFTFISDTDIFDMTQATNPIQTKPSGYLLTKDGTRYRVTQGQIKWIRDRNGNLLTFTYESSIGRLTGIKDSLNREVTISYSSFEPNPFMSVWYSRPMMGGAM